mgnify:CR=1 FL=1
MATRIMLIGNTARGLLQFRGNLIRELSKEKYEVLSLAPDLDNLFFTKLINLGAKPIHYSLSRTGTNIVTEIISIFSLARIIRNEKPDLIFCFQIKPAIYGSISAAISRIKEVFIMIEGLGYVFTQDTTKNKFLRIILSFFLKASFNKAKKVFFLNHDDRDEFVRRSIIKIEKAYVLGGIGVDLAEWTYVEPPVKPVSFIFVGRLLKEKGIIEFLKAAEYIKRKYPMTEFAVLGDMDGNPGCIRKEEISPYVDRGIIEWPGFVEARTWLAKSSVFVLPSYREGLPRSTQEAMAMGRAVITTDVPGCRETVINGVNGFLIRPKDVAALAKAMERFILSPELIKKMGKESRRMAEQKFDVREKNETILKQIGLD